MLGGDAKSKSPFNARRLLRASLAAPFVALVLLDPSRLVMSATGLTESASVALLLVTLAAGLWVTEAIPLYVTSLLLLFLELAWLLPVMEAEALPVTHATFLAPFFSNVILLFLGGFSLSTAFRRYFLDRMIAKQVLARTGGDSRAVVAAIMCVSAFLSMWMSNTATAAMMLGLCIPLLEKIPSGDPLRRCLPLAVAVGANLGGLGTPIGTPPNAIVVESLSRIGSPVTFLSWMMMSIPLLSVFLAFGWWILLRLYPPKVSKLVIDETEVLTFSLSSWVTIGVTAITGVLWLTGEFHHLPTGTVALIPVIVFFGGRVLDRKDFQNLPWDVLILAGGGLSLGMAVEVTGLGNALVKALPLSSWGVLAVTAGVAVLAAMMTTVMSNTATANLLVPIVSGLSVSSAAPLLIVLAYACSCTMILPVSTPPNTMAFSSGEIDTRDMVRTGLWVSAFALVVTVLVGPHWWAVVLG